MNLHRYDAIVFDFDETLIQSKDIKTWTFGALYIEKTETANRSWRVQALL